HYNRRLCLFSQSHLSGVLDHHAWPVLGIPQLATPGLSRRRHLVVPPASAARRSIPDPTLWQGVLGVLCSRQEIRLSCLAHYWFGDSFFEARCSLGGQTTGYVL